ncbi:MAG: hypothetical protein MI802_04490, partial [Desulfobacterales bacterium]|nr:hypothetical protein [Desulfobacterales bacterium]
LGCGTVGGSSTSDNVGPQHLFNVRYVAYDNGVLPQKAVPAAAPAVAADSDMSAEVERITRMVLSQLEKM